MVWKRKYSAKYVTCTLHVLNKLFSVRTHKNYTLPSKYFTCYNKLWLSVDNELLDKQGSNPNLCSMPIFVKNKNRHWYYRQVLVAPNESL